MFIGGWESSVGVLVCGVVARGGISGRKGPNGVDSGGRSLCTSLACATEHSCRRDIMYKSFRKRPKTPLIAETCTKKLNLRNRAVYIRDLYTGVGQVRAG